MRLTLLTGQNGNVLIFTGLINGLDKFNNVADPSVNDATGDAELLNDDETSTGFTKPAFAYMAGSKGNYIAQAPADWQLVENVEYKIRVRLTGAGGEGLDGIYDAIAKKRTN